MANVFNSTLPLLKYSRGDGYFDVALPMLTLEITGTNDGRFELELPLMTVSMVGGGRLDLSLPALTFEATQSLDQIGSFTLTLPRLSFSTSGIRGGVGSFSESLPALSGVLTGWSNTSGSIADSLPLLVGEFVSFAAYTSVVMNTDNTAVTEYSNFNFNSMAMIGDSMFAADANGIHLVGGSLDGSAKIEATAKTMATDFDTGQLKTITSCHTNFPEAMIRLVKDKTDESPWSLTDGKRAKFGRGVKGKYWAIEMKNRVGGDFDVDSLEFRALVTKTRRVA